jgi:hypothetical protein
MSEEEAGLDRAQRARIAEIVDQLRNAIERLDELQFDVLREAASRRNERPMIDKTLTQARRSLEKAVHLLSD